MKSMHTLETLETMICPCCGNARSPEICASCQARQVAAPMLPPETHLPSLGPAFTAVLIAVVIFAAFLGAWLLSNDMKVARVLLVTALGESTTFTKSLLLFDSSLLEYRIFTFDAYRLACYLSLGLIPLSLIGLALARRARNLATLQPLQFGGRRMATGALACSLFFFVVFSAAGISWIPRAIQQGRAKHIAAVRAEFYRLHVEALNRHYAEFGTYPQELSDMRDFSATVIPSTDYWGNALRYAPTALIASKNSTPGYSNYQLVSAGPDGVLGTADDIRMVDGVIVNATDDDDWFASFFALRNNEKLSER
jgi:hypothetical protein